MVQLPASKLCPDHWDFERAIRNTAEANRRYIHHKLRAGALASESVAAGAVAFQDRNSGRVFEAEGFPIEQGDSESERALGYCTIYWTLVESDGDTGPEWIARSLGPDVLCRFRRAFEEELYRVCRGIPYGEPIHTQDCPAKRGGGGDTGGGERCSGCL